MNKKNEIINIINSGCLNSALIAEKVGCTQRFVQQVMYDISEFKQFGRAKTLKIFSVQDLYLGLKDKTAIPRLINERFKEYYIKTNKKLMYYDIDSNNKQIARSKLRALVLERDNFECVDCKSSIALEVHHEKPVRDFPELEFDIDNCKTLCRSCHREIPI